MGKLNEDEIRKIIKRASVIQKFRESSPGNAQFNPDEYEALYEIADNFNINRNYIREALLEHQGIEADDPVMVETNNSHDIHILAHVNGSVDAGLLNELKAQLEYHFNTVGKIHRRKNRIFWRAKPAGPSRLFAVTNSPEFEIEEKAGRMKFSLKQSLKTINKFYFPAIAATFASFMMLAAVVLDASGNEEGPFLAVSGIFLTLSFLYARFVQSRKKKRRDKLVELMEVLQQIAERQFRSRKSKTASENLSQIEIEDIQENDSESEIVIPTKLKS